jgi:UDP-N-acetyl-D-mannosaminuronate dehydrogenase
MKLKHELMAKFTSKTATVGVIGLGYVGLPLALTFIDKGFEVIGFDTDDRKTAALRQRRCYIQHIPHVRIAGAMASDRFRVSSNFDALAECDAVIICVPTPLTEARDPDLSFVIQTAEQIKARLRRGQLIVLESTTYPGTTDSVLLEIFAGTSAASTARAAALRPWAVSACCSAVRCAPARSTAFALSPDDSRCSRARPAASGRSSSACHPATRLRA